VPCRCCFLLLFLFRIPFFFFYYYFYFPLHFMIDIIYPITRNLCLPSPSPSLYPCCSMRRERRANYDARSDIFCAGVYSYCVVKLPNQRDSLACFLTRLGLMMVLRERPTSSSTSTTNHLKASLLHSKSSPRQSRRKRGTS